MLRNLFNCALAGAVMLSVCFAFVLTPVAAQAATIDLSPLLTSVLDIVFPVVGVVLLYFVRRALNAFEERTNIQLDAQLKERLNEALMNGVRYGRSRVEQKYSTRSLTIEAKNELIAHAASYAVKAVPAAIDYFKLSSERLTELLEARLQQDLNGDGVIGVVKDDKSLIVQKAPTA